MKKIFKTLAIVAVAALGFACQNEIDEQVNGNEGEKVTVEVVGSVADLTRSVFGETPTTQEGTVPSTWSGNETVGFSVNGAALVSAENEADAETPALFRVEFDEIKSNDVVYAFSPAATFGEIAEGVIAVNIPATQTPLATSVAENVHLLAANATYNGGAMTMNFGHIAAYGKMNITGFDGEIASVAITFPNGVAGACEYDYVNGTWSGATEKTITLEGNQSSYWFGIAPTVMDENMTIVVTDSESKTYTKKLFTAGKLPFIQGHVSNFTVNMAGVKEDVEVPDPETIDFTAQGYANQAAVESASSTNFTVTFDKGSNSNATKWYDNGSALRAYGGNTFTVSSKNENTISKIVLTFGSSDGSNEISTNVGTFSTDTKTKTGTWAGSANDVTFTIGGSTGNRRITSITVTFGVATAEDTREEQTLVFACEGEVDPNQTLILYAAKTLQEQFVQPTLSGKKSFTKYSSSNEQIATVDSEGNVTIVATKTGNATITATAVEDGNYKAAQATYTITIDEPTLTGVSGNGIWAADNKDGHEFTLAGKYLDQTEISYNTLEHFNVSLVGTTLTVTPNDENDTEEDIVETLTVTIPTGDEQSVTLTHNAPTAEGGVWTLVTDASSLNAGDQIVIAAANANYAMSTTQNENNRAQALITKEVDDNTLSSIGDAQILTLEAGTKSGTWAFKTESGYIYAASSSKNYLRTGTKNDNASWKVDIDTNTGVATIKAQGTYTRNWLRYNSTNTPPIFSCYGSGQADVVIYRWE